MTDSVRAAIVRVWAFVSSVKTIAITVAAVFGLYGTAAAVGLDIPRWAWFTELRVVSDRVNKNRVELLEQALRNWKAERRIIAREKNAAVKKGEQPHPRLLQDEEEADDQIKDLSSRLRKIRGF